MDADEKEIRKKTLIIMAIIVLVILIGGFAYYVYQKEQQISDMADAFALEKEALMDEAFELSTTYEGQIARIGNDSLLALLTTEQMKVSRLIEELRTVKITNEKRINELSREIVTLRSVMRSYVIQIDSLNSENQQLRVEKEQATRRAQQATSQVTQLTRQNEQLTERITVAERLNAAGIQAKLINAKGKDVKKIDQADQIVFTFQIAKNISAPVGEKNLYFRIMKPDDDVLQNSNSGVFPFEGKNIAYSMMKLIEYDGEEIPQTVYWKIGTYLSAGIYRIDIFADGNNIGRKSFTLER
jgi:acetolactate synthase small subunit